MFFILTGKYSGGQLRKHIGICEQKRITMATTTGKKSLGLLG